MNVADSNRVAAALEDLNYTPTNLPNQADVIVLNTCVVRESAEQKAIGRLTSLKPLKLKNPDLVINLMFCGGEIFALKMIYQWARIRGL